MYYTCMLCYKPIPFLKMLISFHHSNTPTVGLISAAISKKQTGSLHKQDQTAYGWTLKHFITYFLFNHCDTDV